MTVATRSLLKNVAIAAATSAALSCTVTVLGAGLWEVIVVAVGVELLVQIRITDARREYADLIDLCLGGYEDN